MPYIAGARRGPAGKNFGSREQFGTEQVFCWSKNSLEPCEQLKFWGLFLQHSVWIAVQLKWFAILWRIKKKTRPPSCGEVGFSGIPGIPLLPKQKWIHHLFDLRKGPESEPPLGGALVFFQWEKIPSQRWLGKWVFQLPEEHMKGVFWGS